ncbi:hypothetical protein BJ944DRAFT_239157 [Cunninghamella echinulata]|nr:hypothetical protein BJ944DRAFT_239157 [Cunninghamella echinulata]
MVVTDYFKQKEKQQLYQIRQQLLRTPDYTAHITSFDLKNLRHLCYMIVGDIDLNSIQYLWIDVILSNQQNHQRKKSTILQTSEICERASYILAIFDYHIRPPGNENEENYKHVKDRMEIADDGIILGFGKDMFSTEIEYKERVEKITVYQFLTYLLNGWLDPD